LISDFFLTYVLVLLATGIIVGFTCGLLGVGGGFIMVPVQIWALTTIGIDPTIATRVAFGTSLSVVLPTALRGCQGHSCRGVVLWRQGISLGIFGLLGAFIGGTVAAHTPGDQLRMIFGMIMLIGALRMYFMRKIMPKGLLEGGPKDGLYKYIFWGLIVGIVSGLSGIGGGLILIPVMIIALGFGVLQAVGTSSITIAFNAAGGVLAYAINGWGVPGLTEYSFGYIDILQFVLLASTSVFTASWGVSAAHKLPAEKLKSIFVFLMLFIGLRMIGIFG
jgi:uncharacterized protein